MKPTKGKKPKGNKIGLSLINIYEAMKMNKIISYKNYNNVKTEIHIGNSLFKRSGI